VIAAGRMIIFGSYTLLLLLGVGRFQITFVVHLYNSWMAITLPACQTHHVATGYVGIGAACTDAHVRVFCKGARMAGTSFWVELVGCCAGLAQCIVALLIMLVHCLGWNLEQQWVNCVL